MGDLGMKRLITALLMVGLCAPAMAEETAIGKNVSVELNSAETDANSCTLSFLVINGYEQQIDKLVFEAVLFDSERIVDRLTLFNFGTLPPARPRVRQFKLDGTTCENLGQVLINGLHACEGEGLKKTACMDGLELRSRTDIEVVG